MSRLKFRVAYLTHKYTDCSDKPRLQYRIVGADTSDEAREVVRSMETVGSGANLRHIGMIHEAEVYDPAAPPGRTP